MKPLYFAFLACCLLFLACVSPYDLDFNSQSNILFIEADINDFDENQNVIVKRNIPTEGSPTFESINDAKVIILENNNKEYIGENKTEGLYALPKGFKAKTNTPYQLKVILSGGETYLSSVEQITPTPKIDSIYANFVGSGVEHDSKKLPGHDIFIDLTDSPAKDDYYLWRYKYYEKKDYCRSCDGGRYFTSPAPLGRCVDEAFLRRANITYDYGCSRPCWKIFYSDKINIMSDQLSNGKKIRARKIGSIPLLQESGALVEVEQHKLSKAAFDYFNIIISQTQNTGSLADTPPVGLVGNLKNINNIEPVGGIFSVSSKTLKTYFLRRPERIVDYFYYGLNNNGRRTQPEPTGNDTTRPPQAPCLEDKYSTGNRPFGWIN